MWRLTTDAVAPAARPASLRPGSIRPTTRTPQELKHAKSSTLFQPAARRPERRYERVADGDGSRGGGAVYRLARLLALVRKRQVDRRGAGRAKSPSSVAHPRRGILPRRGARRSNPRALRMRAQTRAPHAAPNESSASSDESVTDAPSDDAATEASILQALDEPDDEARFLRLQEAVGSGAEVPVDRMHEVLGDRSFRQGEGTRPAGPHEQPEATPEQVRAIAEDALANPSLDVRTRAQRILDQMDELERMDRESRQIERAM